MDSTITDAKPPLSREPIVLPRSEHPISRKDIDRNALTVLYRLSSLGYRAYLVGGSVRDLFLSKTPKDFDVATDARPSRLKKIFKNCRIIGRRFRIAHVFFPDGNIVEVSTFRRGVHTWVKTGKGMVLSDNEYGTPEEDALRRDLTINGLFYDIDSFSLIDYVGGVEDLRNRIVRTIADPCLSFEEDPVRMIRVQRHAARTGFEIEPTTLSSIFRKREHILESNPARLFEETLRDLRGGAAEPFYQLMLETHLLDAVLPTLSDQLRTCGPDHPFWRRIRALDRVVSEGATYSNPLLLSVLLHTVLFPDQECWTGKRNNPPDVWRYLNNNWRDTTKGFRISRRDTERLTQILVSFRKLVQSTERQRLLPVLMKKPYLSEALDFLKLDLESRSESTDTVEEWRSHAPPPAESVPRYRTDDRNGTRSRRRPRARGTAEPASPTEAPANEEGGRRRRRRRRKKH